MRKKSSLYIAIAFAAAAFGLAACSPSSAAAMAKPAESAAKEVVESVASSAIESAAAEKKSSAADILKEIQSQVDMPNTMELPAEYIMNYYGIDTSEVSDSFFVVSEVSTSAETVILAKTESEEQAAEVQETLQTILDQKAEETENYLPEQYKIVSKSQVRRVGNAVYLIISEHEDEIRAIIEAAL